MEDAGPKLLKQGQSEDLCLLYARYDEDGSNCAQAHQGKFSKDISVFLTVVVNKFNEGQQYGINGVRWPRWCLFKW